MSLMTTAEVVERNVQRHGSFMILKLLAESVSQAS